MTFTRSEKRREIAARLRIASILCKPRYYISHLSKISPEQNAFDVLERDVFERILACVGYEYGNIFDYLADLIDRPTCKNVSEDQDVFECSECRCKAEMIIDVCNEYGDTFSMSLMPSFCPECGSEVMDNE